jgi:hypothetical protein
MPAGIWRVWDGMWAEAGGDMSRVVELLGNRVVNNLDDEAVQAFQARFIDVTGRLHTWRHRAPLEMLLGDCTEHAFPYLAAFLVAHGRASFDLFAADADTLAGLELAGPPSDIFDQLTFGTALPQYAYAYGDSIGGCVLVRRPNWRDDDFDRTHPAWASTTPPAGSPYTSGAAAAADLPRTAAATGRASALRLPDWQLINIGPRVRGSGPPQDRPTLVAIDHDDYHAEHVGRLPDGRQFFLTTPFEPGGDEFVALYLFDAAGRLTEALIDNFGPRATVDEKARRKLYKSRLKDLGKVENTRIEVQPFSVERFGLSFGLIAREPEYADEHWWVEVRPGNYMAFAPPWDSGEYDT